jgi:hypothetical protein
MVKMPNLGFWVSELFFPMVKRLDFHLFVIEENERWCKSDHGFWIKRKKESTFGVKAKFDSQINS